MLRSGLNKVVKGLAVLAGASLLAGVGTAAQAGGQEPTPEAVRWYVALFEHSATGNELPPLPVDLSVGNGLARDYDAATQTLHVRFPMVFNRITEGWSWRDDGDRSGGTDYYRYSFLPVGSVSEERKIYTQEDKIGAPQQTAVVWRWDYFLAFDNLYDFYTPQQRVNQIDDEAGFNADLHIEPAAAAGLLAEGRLQLMAVLAPLPPTTAESTTFWKAIHARPTDFTLKKRYLRGELREVRLVDRESGKVLHAWRPLGKAFAGQGV